MIFSDERLAHHALVLGAGGVGHALARALAAHPRVASVTATHRGAATERDGIPYQSLDLTDDEAIAAFGAAQVSGPQAPNLIFYTAGLLHGEGLTPEKRLAEVESAALMVSYRINAVAPLLLAKALSPGLPRRGPARQSGQPWLQRPVRRRLRRILLAPAGVRRGCGVVPRRDRGSRGARHGVPVARLERDFWNGNRRNR